MSSEPMPDERLAEIEARAAQAAEHADDVVLHEIATLIVPDLIAEVRRLNVALAAAKALRRMHYEDYIRVSDELIALRPRLEEAERKAGYWEVAKTDLFGIVDPPPD